RGVARDVELSVVAPIFTAVLALVFTAVFAPVFLPVLAAVFPSVFLVYVGGLRKRPDRLRQGRKESDGSNSGCDEASARHGIPFQGLDPGLDRRFPRVPGAGRKGHTSPEQPWSFDRGGAFDWNTSWNISAERLWGAVGPAVRPFTRQRPRGRSRAPRSRGGR